MRSASMVLCVFKRHGLMVLITSIVEATRSVKKRHLGVNMTGLDQQKGWDLTSNATNAKKGLWQTSNESSDQESWQIITNASRQPGMLTHCHYF